MTEEPVRVYHTGRNIFIGIAVVLVIVFVAVFGLRSVNAENNAPKGSKENPVVIGVVGATNPQWVAFQDEALKQGIYVQIKDFQDYTSENPALAAGSLDMNEFQHLLYLANFNVKNNEDLQPIGGDAIYPLGLYPTYENGKPKYKSINELPANATVAIPNDETNQSRAIGVLKAAGLITLNKKWTPFTIPQDIDTAHSRVKVVAMKAEQIANSLKSDPTIAAGVINNDYVADAGLVPEDAIYHDDADSEEARPYINVFVVRKADVDNDVYRKIVKIYQTKPVMDALQKLSGGTAVFADKFSAEELQQYLADIEQDIRDESK
ncbi:MetQ/NlpA family ABC transporter substrate-binding protein [Bifidobacterium dolichotidis]|nr:MetQ/NlpA family ABC transporter substrate-binding protein [Bifidobacterium dolichotidis]